MATMDPVAELTIEALNAGASGALRHYRKALRVACEYSPPPYGTARYGQVYRTVAVDPSWLAASLITSSEREADGATRLWSLAACTSDTDISQAVKRHAIDEARHARWYVALLDIAFPGAVDDSLRPALDSISPRYDSEMQPTAVEGSPFAYEMTLDDLIQSNIAEIRTSINHRLQRPVLMAHCAPERRRKLSTLLDRLLRDEIAHIEYTARLIERFAARGGEALVLDLMRSRMDDFNEITCDEIDQNVFPLHCSSQSCRRGVDGQGSCPLAAVAAAASAEP